MTPAKVLRPSSCKRPPALLLSPLQNPSCACLKYLNTPAKALRHSSTALPCKTPSYIYIYIYIYIYKVFHSQCKNPPTNPPSPPSIPLAKALQYNSKTFQYSCKSPRVLVRHTSQKLSAICLRCFVILSKAFQPSLIPFFKFPLVYVLDIS